jgi:hypothetical protein
MPIREKKNLVCFYLICALLHIVTVGSAWAADFVVSTTGNDNNPGTEEKPFATIERARDAVRRKIAQGISENITVLIRGGVYYITEPIVFGAEDSGSEQFSITYAAYPAEAPVISGGRVISGWTVNQNGLWQREISDVKDGKWYFRELFVNGQRRIRARHPNKGFLYAEKVVDERRILQFHKRERDNVPAIKEIGETEMIFLHDWSISRNLLESIDPVLRRIKTAQQVGWTRKGQRKNRSEMSYYSRHPRYFLENNPAFLDRSGEWYLDRQSGVLIYKPMEDEIPSEVKAIAPLAPQLLLVRKVKNLHFKGLSFKHCSWLFDDGRYAGAQASFSHPLNTPRSKAERWWIPVTPALLFEFAESCSIEDVTLANLGGSGIWLNRGCSKNKIIGCHIYDIAANGVMIGETEINKVTETEAAANNTIRNNVIELCGKEYYGAHGVWIGFSRENNVAHNEVRYHPYGAISVGWSWQPDPTPCKGNIIEYNNIHHAMLILSDSGGIYTLGFQPGTILRGNWIHDIPVNAGKAQSNGIFLDCGSTSIVVEENVIHDVACSPIRFNKATTNTVKNNLLIIKPVVPPHIKYRNTNPKGIEEIDNTIIVLGPKGKNYPQKLIEKKAKTPGLEKDYREKLLQSR